MPKPKPYKNMREIEYQLGNLWDNCTGAPEDAKLNKYKMVEAAEDGKIIHAKRFNQDSYNAATLSDFTKRLQSVYDTACQMLETSQTASDLSTDEYQGRKEILDELYKKARDELKEQCTIQPINLNELTDKAHEKSLVDKIDDALVIIRAFAAHAIAICDKDSLKDTNHLYKAQKRFLKTESKLVAERGSPNFVNFYQTQMMDRVSIGRVVGDFIPSTERKGDQGTLPNFFEYATGYFDKGGEYHPQFSCYRHSSYPPIQEKDQFIRKAKMAGLVDTMLQEIAENKISAEELAEFKKTGKPIAVKLASTSLISPVELDLFGMNSMVSFFPWIDLKKLEKFIPFMSYMTYFIDQLSSLTSLTDVVVRGGEQSEQRQLMESYQALMCVNQQEIAITLQNGQRIVIKPQMRLFNTPSNAVGIHVSKYWNSITERRMNTEAMNRYIEQTESYLKGKGFDLSSGEGSFEFSQSSDELQKQWNTQSKTLQSLNAQLLIALKINQKSDAQVLSKQIGNVQNELHKLDQAMMQARFEQYAGKREGLQKFIEKIASDPAIQSDVKQIAILYYQSLAMYWDNWQHKHSWERWLTFGKDKGVNPAEVDEFCSLALYEMGWTIEKFCKSGEDRTGMSMIRTETLLEFQRQMHRLPKYDFATQQIDGSDLKKLDEIKLVINEFSVSRDIADANAPGARGLKVHKEYTLLGMKFINTMNEGLPVLSGKKLGNNAKKIYESIKQQSLPVIKKWLPLKQQGELPAWEAVGANQLVEETEHGFHERVIKLNDTSSVPRRITKARTEVSSENRPTYKSLRIKEDEHLVAEKTFKVQLQNQPPREIVGRLAYSGKGKSQDATDLSEGRFLSDSVNIELALHQASMLLRPPFSPKNGKLILNGDDSKQVARLHAAILWLKECHPSLKDLHIFVEGDSEKPALFATNKREIQSNIKTFINKQLGYLDHDPSNTAHLQKENLKALIVESKKQVKSQYMKQKEGELSVFPGENIRPKGR